MSALGEGRATTTTAPLDLRLLVPGMVAWSSAVWLTGRPATDQLAGVGVSVAVLVAASGVALRQRAAHQRRDGGRAGVLARRSSWSVTVAFSAAAACVVLACAATDRQVDTAGPVSGLAEQGAVAEVRGTVLTQPRRLDPGPGGEARVALRLRVDRVLARGAVSHPSTPVLVLSGPRWEQVPWRSTVSTTGRLFVPRDEGGRGVTGDVAAFLSPTQGPTLVRGPPAPLRVADGVRARLRAAVAPLPGDARALIPGLVIGDTSMTSPELKEAMLETGMSHLSAVSGSNVAIVLAAVVLVCRQVGVPRRLRAPLAAAALVAFVLVCRPEPSVLRAGVMGMIGLAGLSASRRASTLPALGAAVLVLLCADPQLARSYGFALSVLATLGLTIFARPWGDAFAARLPRPVRVLGHAVAIPLAAQVVCAPVIVLLQGDVAVVAVLANLLAAPVVAVTTVAGVLAALGACIWVPLGTGIAAVAVAPAWWIATVARLCSGLPGGQMPWLDGAVGAWTLAVLTAAALVSGPRLMSWIGRRPGLRWGLVAVAAAALVPLPVSQRWPPPPGWSVVACDVGQGDAFVLPAGTRAGAVVIDVGPPRSGVVACLRDLGVERVEALVLSHFHRDHVGGLEEVLDALDVRSAYVTPVRDPPAEARRTLGALQEAGVPTRTAVGGTRLRWPAGHATVVWPDPGRPVLGASAANNGSLVLDVTTGSTRVLFTGDIEAEASARVRRLLAGRHFDVLKVAHHGSADQDEALVRATGADLALIGVGAENTFGHPTTSALTMLRGSGMRVRRTDMHGHIAVVPTRTGLGVLSASAG